MKLRFYFLFIFFTLLFLFYPGDSPYFHVFAYNRSLFNQQETPNNLNIENIPFIKFPYYPFVTAEGVYVADLPSFTPIYEKNIHSRFLPASTAKIIAGLVAYEIYQPDQIITVKKTVEEGQSMGLIPGEKISVENLLYGLLIHSANDAAYVLAENFGQQKFIDLMNIKSQSLSMKNSHFTNPMGFDNNDQFTSPFDLALAARELLNNPYLAKIVSIKEITISDTDYHYFHQLTNVNKLLGEIQGIGGLKTGYTANAGENLVSFYKKNGHQFIIVILKSVNRFEDTKSILRWIEENVDYLKL